MVYWWSNFWYSALFLHHMYFRLQSVLTLSGISSIHGMQSECIVSLLHSWLRYKPKLSPTKTWPYFHNQPETASMHAQWLYSSFCACLNAYLCIHVECHCVHTSRLVLLSSVQCLSRWLMAHQAHCFSTTALVKWSATWIDKKSTNCQCGLIHT